MPKKSTIEVIIGNLLLKGQKTLAIAESCTGGLISNRITDVPGSSNYFKMSVIAYSNESKKILLNIPLETIKRYGAVSQRVASLMAENVRHLAGTDFGIGVTGLCGPSGATPGPVAAPLVGTIDEAVAATLVVAPDGAGTRPAATSGPVAAPLVGTIDEAVAATLVVAPDGAGTRPAATTKKPVGLVYIAVSSKNKTRCREFRFSGERKIIKLKASQSALEMLRKFL